MQSKKQDKKRHIPKPKNYADLMRKTRTYHSYSFSLPRAQATKKDLDKIRKSKAISTLWESGQYTVDEIQKIIKRKAIDLSIDRKLSPQQKTAITKQWYGSKNKTGLKNAIQHVESDEAQFVPIKNASNKELLKRMKHTNKGVFMFESGVDVKVVGRGKKLRLDIKRKIEASKGQQIFKRREMFFPFPKGVLLDEYIENLVSEYKPNSVAIGVMSSHGNASYSDISGLNYVWDAIKDYEYKGQKHPFSGVYFYWY